MPNLLAHSNLLRTRIFQAIALPGPNLRRLSSRTNHTEPAVKLVSSGFFCPEYALDQGSDFVYVAVEYCCRLLSVGRIFVDCIISLLDVWHHTHPE